MTAHPAMSPPAMSPERAPTCSRRFACAYMYTERYTLQLLTAKHAQVLLHTPTVDK